MQSSDKHCGRGLYSLVRGVTKQRGVGGKKNVGVVSVAEGRD